jgi:hypothetical protein
MVATAGFAGYTRVGGEYKFRPGKKRPQVRMCNFEQSERFPDS